MAFENLQRYSTKILRIRCPGNLVPRAFSLKMGGAFHPFFKGKALGTRLVVGDEKVSSKKTVKSKSIRDSYDDIYCPALN